MNVLYKNKSKFENEISLIKEISESLFKYALEIDKEIPNDDPLTKSGSMTHLPAGFSTSIGSLSAIEHNKFEFC